MRGREKISGSQEWDSVERKAQIDTAITEKTISQLGIHLHTLQRRGVSPNAATPAVGQPWEHLIYNGSMRRGHRWELANNRCRSKQKRKFYRQQENLKQPRGGKVQVQSLFWRTSPDPPPVGGRMESVNFVNGILLEFNFV